MGVKLYSYSGYFVYVSSEIRDEYFFEGAFLCRNRTKSVQLCKITFNLLLLPICFFNTFEKNSSNAFFN